MCGGVRACGVCACGGVYALVGLCARASGVVRVYEVRMCVGGVSLLLYTSLVTITNIITGT